MAILIDVYKRNLFAVLSCHLDKMELFSIIIYAGPLMMFQCGNELMREYSFSTVILAFELFVCINSFDFHFLYSFSDLLFYILCKAAGGKPVTSQRINSSKVLPPLDLKETSAKKQIPAVGSLPKSNEQAVNKSLVVPSMVPRSSPNAKDSANSGRESVAFSKTRRGMLLRPAHVRSPSNSKVDMEKLPLAVESGTFSSMTSKLDSAVSLSSQIKIVSEDKDRESREEKNSAIKSVEEKFEAVLSLKRPSDQETSKLWFFYKAVCL